MSELKIVTIGSALIDIFIHSDQFSLKNGQEGILLCSNYGEKIEVSDFHFLTGGGGGNTAVGFARQEFSTAVISELGQDQFSQHLIADLKQEGVDTEGVIQEKREQTGISVILIAPEGGRTALVHRGAAAMLEETDIDWPALNCDWVHLSSIAGDRGLLGRLFAEKPSKKFGLSWTPGKMEIELLAQKQIDLTHLQPDLMLVNKEEWMMLEPVHQHFQDCCRYVVVTDGRQGGAVWQQGQIVETYTVEPKPAVDETGAGDAFAVGFISAYLRQENLTACCEAGKANAASVVQEFGAKAGLLRRSA